MRYKKYAWMRELILIMSIVLLALMLRKYLLPLHSIDYDKFVSLWYVFIKTHGGMQSLRYNFSGYNEPYLYLLVISTHLPLLQISAIKSISIFFDFTLAAFVYLIVRMKYEQSYLPIVAGLIVLFLPTIFINSAFWAQCDSIYTTFLLGSLYFFLREKPFWACIFFGVAFAFKLQAIFFFPLLFVLWLMGEMRLRYFLAIPLVYVLSIFPAYLYGRKFTDMLELYFVQTTFPNLLSMNAPNLFVLIRVPLQQFSPWKHVGVLLAVATVLILCFVVLASKKKMTNEIMLKLALIFALLMPFLLPEMHERYFYIADVLSLIYAFYFPKYFYIPILVQFCSLESYMPFIMNKTVIDLAYLALLMLAIIVLTTYDLIKNLWPALPQFKHILPPASSV
jgi:Gpi18-like mannosyltransferase